MGVEVETRCERCRSRMRAAIFPGRTKCTSCGFLNTVNSAVRGGTRSGKGRSIREEVHKYFRGRKEDAKAIKPTPHLDDWEPIAEDDEEFTLDGDPSSKPHERAKLDVVRSLRAFHKYCSPDTEIQVVIAATDGKGIPPVKFQFTKFSPDIINKRRVPAPVVRFEEDRDINATIDPVEVGLGVDDRAIQQCDTCKAWHVTGPCPVGSGFHMGPDGDEFAEDSDAGS